MDWISFSWGVGAIIFVNIVYTIWATPKQFKLGESDAEHFLEQKLNVMEAEHAESIKLWEERAEKMRLELDKHTASRTELDKVMTSFKVV
ncbi:unnamed protein product [marine sediment metagenome]|uniref:Uncharacterized protein n=1 Tax=marine sediment metagenome TaxID=412755 RepID=X1UUU2_9ZZZZ